MSKSTLPAPFQNAEGRALRGPVPPNFEAFYRAHLRFLPGGRLRTAELRSRYLKWAADQGAPGMSFRAIARSMKNIGHRQFTSDGVLYADVVFAEHALGEPDNFPAPAPIDPDTAATLGRQIDRLGRELDAFRAVVGQLSGQLSGRPSRAGNRHEGARRHGAKTPLRTVGLTVDGQSA